MQINTKRRSLKNSHSTQLMPANVGGKESLTNHPLTDRIMLQIGSNTSGNKYFFDTFYTQRESKINEPHKKRNLGITLSKIELPSRLIQQKELFNEMGGWLKSASKERQLTSSQSNSKKLLTNKLASSMTQFHPNSSQTSLLTHPDALQQEKKKPNFYEHQHIFRVKDFKKLKNREDIIAKSVDDPISIGQRRILIQEFEIKVQQFLRILKFKNELGSKTYSKYYKTVEQTFGGLNSFNFNQRASSQGSLYQMHQNQNTQVKNSLNNTQNVFMNHNNNEFNNGQTQHDNVNGNSGFINNDQAFGNIGQKENGLNQGNNGSSSEGLNSYGQNLQKHNKNAMSYPNQKDQIIQSIPQTKKLMQKVFNQSNQSFQQTNQGEISSNISQFSQYQQSGQKHKSFIDRNKDIEWQYNTYYQINQHQFQELSEKQINYLTTEEREQYYNVLDHFKQVGHRFQVQVALTEKSDQNLQTLATEGDENYGNANISDMRKSRKQIQTSHSTSRLALHQRLQDYILDQCKNYLNSDDTNYDEKLRFMKKQYEQMLDNFEKKSHKIWLPKNIRPRNQGFNDYYIYDDSENELNKYQKQIFQDITQENFGSILSINMDLIKDQYPMQIEEEKEIQEEQDIEKIQDEKKKQLESDNDEEEYDDDDEYSEYDETPYSQRKLRNQKRVIKVPQVNSPAHTKPQNKTQQTKKKKELNIQKEISPNQKDASPSLKSEKGDESDSSFSKSVNTRHLSQQLTQSIDNSPYVRSKHSQSVAHRSIKNSPRSNKAAVDDSEDEDKVDDQQIPPKKPQGRSQFSKKAPPSTSSLSKILISINDIKSEKSGNSTPKNEDEKQEEIEAGPKSLQSVDALSSTPESSTRRKKIQRRISDDGFEQAHDILEELKIVNPEDNIYKNNNQNKPSKNSDEVSFDLGSNKNVKSQKKIRGPGENKDNKSGLKRENSQSSNNSGSNRRINNNPAGGVSSFKQKIVNEIKMEEERNKEQDQEMEIVTLGTGLFDRIFSTNSYLDLDYNKYFKHYKKAPPINPHLQHKSDFDRQIFIKMSQWEYELNEDNENYALALDNIAETLLQVQQGNVENKNKNKKSNKTHSNIPNNQKSSQSIQQPKHSLNDSIIEGQAENQSPNQGDTSFFREVSPSIGNQLNRIQSQSIQYGHSRNPSRHATVANSPSNRSQILVLDSQSQIKGKELPNLKHNQSSFQDSQQQIKKQSQYQQDQSKNEKNNLKTRKVSISSESEDSQKPSSKSSYEELVDLNLPQHIPKLSDSSDLDQ